MPRELRTRLTDKSVDPLGRPLTTRQQAIADKRRAEQARQERLRQDAADLAARKAAEARARPPAPNGKRGDGNFYLTFIHMGQGDCTLMTTPQGQFIMIDCGTNSKDSEGREEYVARIRDVMNRKHYLGVKKIIDVLILTHPDKDHYNMLDTVVPDGVSPTIVYHSDELSRYAKGARWVNERGCTDGRAKKVVLNQLNGIGDLPTISGAEVARATRTQTIEKLDRDGGITIIDEQNCKVTILASGVREDHDRDGDKGTNRGSVVTLIEVFGKRLLLNADATRSTEMVLLGRYGDRLRDLDLVQVGHHGSNRTSSAQNFVRHVNPHHAVISAGEIGHPVHHLPSWRVIERYEQVMSAAGRPAVDAHLTTAWVDHTEPASSHTRDVTMPIFVTGSSKTQHITISRPG